MDRFKLEYLLHWIFSIVFGILLITGLALLGPKYGWILNYNLALADYLHRTLAVTFSILLCLEVLLEIRRIVWLKGKREPWLVIGKNRFGLVTFFCCQVLIISGILIWLCTEDGHAVAAFAAMIHEKATFIMAAGLIWHIYDKSHVLTIGGNRK